MRTTTVKEQQEEPGRAPEDTEHCIATVLQEVVADYIKQEVEKAVAAILELVEEGTEKLLRDVNFKVQLESGLLCTMPWNTSISIRSRRAC